MIEARDIDVFYGNIQALKKVSLSVGKREIVALLGANGAGKSTMLKAVVGILQKRSGDVYFDGQRITRMPTASIVKLGISLVPESRRLFGPLSVIDNLKLGGYLRLREKRSSEVQKDIDAVLELFPALQGRIGQAAGTLSGGEQQMLAIARALMARPKAILMDEPSMGLAPIIVREIFLTIKRLKEKGNTIWLVEQNARMALKVSDRAYVLEGGRVTLEEKSQNLLETELVRKSYLNG